MYPYYLFVSKKVLSDLGNLQACILFVFHLIHT